MEMRHFAGYFASIKAEYECSLSNQHFQYDCSHPSATAMASQTAPTSESWFTTWYFGIQAKLDLANAAFAHAAHGQQYAPRHIRVTLTCFITASPVMLVFGKNYLLTLSS